MAPGVASSKRRAPFQREAHFLSGHRAQARGAGLPSFSSSPGATTTNYLACPCWIPEVGSASEDNHVSARCTQLIPSVPQGTLVPRLVHSMTAQNDRLPISNARRGLASTPRAWSIETGQCSGTGHAHHLGPCPRSRKRDQKAARSNMREAALKASAPFW